MGLKPHCRTEPHKGSKGKKNMAIPTTVETNSGNDALKAELLALKNENEKLKQERLSQKSNRAFAAKVAAKGGVQMTVPGQRFPCTLYPGDVVAILENA